MEHLEKLEDRCRAEPVRRAPVANLIMLVILVVALLVAWRFFSPHSAHAAGGWTEDWDAAVEQSRASGKPALVLFTADWCPSCRQLESQVLTDANVQQYLRDNLTPVIVDLTDRSGPNVDLARERGITAIPTLILYDRAGQELSRCNGMPADELLSWMRSAR
ncbi:MAG TPA: thioredoxin family protein [Tepidisphaeraceae bacterium]